ncbi:MAG: hypothetical protein M1401_03575 [Chloroflexi bacterium]|nr:hypothetical protein [Chloroflexota bacterium]
MAIALDILSLLLFPGLVFVVLIGVGTMWVAQRLGEQLRGGQVAGFADLVGRSRQLAHLATHPAPEELDWASAALLLGLFGAAGATTAFWRSIVFPSAAWGQAYIALGLLLMPLLAVLYWSDWRARSRGRGRQRDLLLLLYTSVLVCALAVPAVAARSLLLAQVVSPVGRSLPAVFSLSGGLAFLAAAVAAAIQLALLDAYFEDCLGMVSGAVQALLLQLLRAACWVATVSVLALLYWSLPGSPLGALPATFLAYALGVVLLVVLRDLLRRSSLPVADLAWLPLGLLVALALAFAAGGW